MLALLLLRRALKWRFLDERPERLFLPAPRFEPDRGSRSPISMVQGLMVIGGFVLIGLAAYGFWQGLKLKPHENIPPSKGGRWRT
jgi:hypothetical protein